MTFYEIATLRTVIFGAGKAAAGLEAWLDEGEGRLLGAFGTDIGELNVVYLLRAFDGLDAMMEERRRALMAADPMGCSEHLVGLRFDSYRAFDFCDEPKPGAHGPVYEFRTYHGRPGKLAEMQDAWRDAMPGREAYSKLSIAMYGLDGAPRVTQIWPYASLAERTEARAQSVKDGKWPPVGGPDCLTPEMSSAIAMPLPFSPMT